MAPRREGELSAEEVAQYLRVSLPTLWRIEREGGIVPRRNRKGQRWYTLKDMQQYLNGSRRER